MDPSNRTVALGDGGWQIGDSNGLLPYNPLYVDGVLEELDSAMEWHVDPIERVIRFHPNQSAVQGGGPAPPPVLTVATALDTVVRIQGTHADPVRNVEIAGFRITGTSSTRMKPYEIPDGGDWAVSRSAAVVIENAEDINVTGCHFDRVGGNVIFVAFALSLTAALPAARSVRDPVRAARRLNRPLDAPCISSRRGC